LQVFVSISSYLGRPVHDVLVIFAYIIDIICRYLFGSHLFLIRDAIIVALGHNLPNFCRFSILLVGNISYRQSSLFAHFIWLAFNLVSFVWWLFWRWLNLGSNRINQILSRFNCAIALTTVLVRSSTRFWHRTSEYFTFFNYVLSSYTILIFLLFSLLAHTQNNIFNL